MSELIENYRNMHRAETVFQKAVRTMHGIDAAGIVGPPKPKPRKPKIERPFDVEGLDVLSGVPVRIETLKQIGLTQLAIAHHIGVSTPTVRRWENGSKLKSKDFERLDDMAYCFKSLIQVGGLEPKAAHEAMTGTSMLVEPLAGRITMEALLESPDIVIGQVYDYALDLASAQAAVEDAN